MDLVTESPSAPVYLRVSDITNQSLTLSWSHPSTDGTDIHYNVSYGGQLVLVLVYYVEGGNIVIV